MKNYRDEKHKKLVMLIVILYIFSIIQNIANIYTGYSISRAIINIIFNLLIILVALTAPPPMTYFDDEVLIKGLLFKKKVYWSEVYRVELGSDYVKVDAGNFKRIKVNLKAFSYDSGLYQRFLDIVRKLIDDKDVEIVYKSIAGEVISADESYDKSRFFGIPSIKTGGWLAYFLFMIYLNAFVSLFLSFSVLIVYMEKSFLYAILYCIFCIFYGVYCILLIVKFTKHRKHTIKVLKIYYFIDVVQSIIANIGLILLPIGRNASIGLPILLLVGVLGILISILYAITMSEYLNVSVRVRNTFVN